MKLFLKLIFIFWSCSACTTISITKSDGDVVIERSFGFASIRPGTDTSVITAKATSFGYISSPLGNSIGFSKQDVTVANDNCRIVIWIDEEVINKEFLDALEEIDNVCITK